MKKSRLRAFARTRAKNKTNFITSKNTFFEENFYNNNFFFNNNFDENFFDKCQNWPGGQNWPGSQMDYTLSFT
jgi:hypothetical protein